MHIWELPFFVSPLDKTPLQYSGPDAIAGCIEQGSLGAGQERYAIENGLPNFVATADLSAKTQSVLKFYDGRSETYDQSLHLTFHSHGEDEIKLRNGFVDLLDV